VSIWVNQEVTEVIAGFDFDDGTGNTTLSPTLTDSDVTVSDFSVGAGLTEVIDTSDSSLAENLDAEQNIFGTDNAISFGGSRDNLGFTRAGDLENAITENEYLTFTVSPASSVQMNFSRFTFRARAEDLTESATSWALYSSVDGFDQANAIANGNIELADEWTDHIIDLSSTSLQGLSETTELRLYIYDGRNNSQSSTLFDKVLLHGELDY